ncbi:MAG: bifunctional hydroxymethylpyrimidine kinase/phosphomethylpyrimidine kinase [Bacteroidales bacterium]|jgi:hydroxymethylpyrimidine/phosphomethylpyrimidine kinase|nr:bifunctional hydroxymethylpyrimidine kinase/phosphomethylpyrimidine kinase [Bacteroidales bacterium]
MNYKRVLTIAGSDSGGGAGIQADIKTMSACGCYGMSAITAVTVQNTLGVESFMPIPPDIIEQQIDAVMIDIGADAVKIGMLSSSEVMLAVKKALKPYDLTNIVLDPVMVSTSGHKLMNDEAIDTLKNELLNMARIITPNIPEAEILLGEKITHQDQLPEFAMKLSNNRNVSVLLKAGHLDDKILIDVLYNAETDSITKLGSKRIYTKNTHGTGCTFSSALASFLAYGLDLESAVGKAKAYVYSAIETGAKYTLGKGHGPVHHFYSWWE